MMMLQHGSPAQSQSQSPSQPQSPSTHDQHLNQDQAQQPRKRKADSQDAAQNERLSKRLSLLNLERNGSKLYVPVENPSAMNPLNPTIPSNPSNTTTATAQDDSMHLDDTAHKVYIYNIDDELTSSESEPDDGRLVFLPDIEKHLRQTRIPPSVLANSEGQLAGMQMVLYSEPKALSVPEENDGVRRAVIEARRRARERQNARQTGGSDVQESGDVDMSSNRQREEDDDADDEAMDMD